MIFETIISAVASLFTFVAGLFPEMDTPTWMGDLAAAVSTVASKMAGLGVWLPFGAAGTAVQLVVTAAGVAILVKLIRVVASFLTAGGGAAG